MNRSDSSKVRNVLLGCATLAALGSTLVACGQFETKDSGRKRKQTKSELAGEWQGTCTKVGFFDFASRQSKLTFSVVGDIDAETVVYTNGACSENALKMSLLGTYDVVGKSELEGGSAHNINITVREARLTPQSDEAASILNKVKYCGLDSWKSGESVDISEKDCAGESIKKGDVVFDVYQKSGNTLHLGDALVWFDKNSPRERPTKLDRDHPFIHR